MTACPHCGVDPDFVTERVLHWKTAWEGQRKLSRDLARKLAALTEERKGT